MRVNNRGFTLVELLVAISLIAVVIVVSADFLINLVSNSVRIQNKIFLEQNYNFIGSKLTKVLQDAENVTVLNPNKLTFTNNGTYTLEVKNGLLLLQNTSVANSPAISLNDSQIVISNIESQNAFESILNLNNPMQVKIKLKFEIFPGNKLGADQNLERVVTIRKSYKN
jgi:prepilin-type N-terminal cleavage/methylation domain-containing protein